MLKYKNACKDTFVANLMMILKFLYLSTILTPTQGRQKAGGMGAIAMSFQIAFAEHGHISLGRFFFVLKVYY